MKTTIKLSDILTDLQNGLTRTKNSSGYNSTIGSIEEKYDLNKRDVSELFKHPALFKKRTIFKKELSFIIEDDITSNESVQAITDDLDVREEGGVDEATVNANDTNSESSIDNNDDLTQEEEVETISDDPFTFN